jgi:mannose-6-phosphate isomerase-like protein (cupin superfamily)
LTEIATIEAGGRLLVLIVRERFHPDVTHFVTDESLPMQVGFIVYPRGGEVARHVHVPLDRTLTVTSEVLIVRTGRCEMDVYDDERNLVTTQEIVAGDVVVIFAGGHGFRMLEDTTFLEVKQGPYTGLDEKERF